MITMMLHWWYGPGWQQAFKRIRTWPKAVGHVFSLSLLVRTLFAPWRRIVTAPGKSFDQKVRAALDNLISRFVGFGVRIIVLIAAVFGMAFAFVCGLLMAVLWPLLPLATIYFLIRGITG